MAALKRRDLDVFPTDPRYVVCAMSLQLYANMDPDGSRNAARRIVDAVLRAGVRPTDGLPTNAEVIRATNVLKVKRGIDAVHYDEMYAALLAALCPGMTEDDE